MAGSKTEKATPKRKEDERKKGNVFQSSEFLIVVSLIVMFYALKFFLPFTLTTLQESFYSFFEVAATTTSIGALEVRRYFIDGGMAFAVTALPLMLVSGLVAVIITLTQTRLLVSFQSMKPKFSRMSPLKGIKKMFSLRSLVELLKSLIKISVLGWILYDAMVVDIPQMTRLMDMTAMQAMAECGKVVFSIVKSCAVAFVFLALFDYIYQWWDYEKNLRMSKDEIKEEYKQTEGDPQIKGKIKERQQAMSRRRMMQSVPSADVVIRNPTHYAVALRYDPDSDSAPIVVAKGKDRVALKIVEIAEQNGIAITENVPLARGLYEAVELDMEIPGDFYHAVAEVLAFVYSLKRKDLKHETVQ